MDIGYVRVSTEEQNEQRQIEGLEKYNIERWYIEKVSGKNTNREQLQAMLDFVREGDTIFVHDFSRLSRSTKDLLDLIDTLEQKQVNIVSNKENIDTRTPQGRLMLTVVGAIYEFERVNMLERQREGIAIAKRNGVYKGRKPKNVDAAFAELYERYLRREITKVEFANKLRVSRPTLDKMIKKVTEPEQK